MTDEEMDRLREAFPVLWQNCSGPWCGSGWFDLLMATSWAISRANPTAVLVQVKEKFGGLRIYASSGTWGNPCNRDSDQVIDYAERLSLSICEECSEPGRLVKRGGYWLKTLCGCCAERHGYNG